MGRGGGGTDLTGGGGGSHEIVFLPVVARGALPLKLRPVAKLIMLREAAAQHEGSAMSQGDNMHFGGAVPG